MGTFDWYGNRVVTKPVKQSSRSLYRQARHVLADAWSRLGLGLIGEVLDR